MKQLFKSGSIVIVMGPGGVGKTTVAAALGLAAADAGFATGVITVDPAKRLRDALGIAGLDGRARTLDPRRLRATGLSGALNFSAMTLDVKRTWDGLVERFVTDPKARRQIYANSFYRNLTERFAGAENYAALEQLCTMHESRRFAVEIVDTPPAVQAFDFIEAPAHLTRLLDSRLAHWIVGLNNTADRGSLRLVNRAMRMVIEQLEGFAGARPLSSVAEFFSATAQATEAITQRMRDAATLLRSPAVSFVLVTTPAEDRLQEAEAIVGQMQKNGLRLSAVVINRAIDGIVSSAPSAAASRLPELARTLGAIRQAVAVELEGDRRSDALLTFLADYIAAQQAAMARAARFARQIPAAVRVIALPEIDLSRRDLSGLAQLAAMLTVTGASTASASIGTAATRQPSANG